mmetsp:Transcript_32778/g.92493  ORF Transcript_32778/g.92493 Transcript_32778/m.92493 type:complete len:873 (-) Transcript_32778:154-2772(-)|eukprot:CAMPEP_0177407652 /NCGR_PEP_ID=MMETSP0368-20130122/63234_1 /TAXON_ID=447022 ORGANISM="Scrippsiella hangoei-like, Strain SHHI-4" /NCGR_SAMPLE_ID=MMETSP0368 /ASSEMBLY_ACC=CAM_ASM_000363 /LENGTH=872 /DNA_ID=CAMNT_0018876187 /DNA_START=13 /DNA_END=2631 /DNA_ORIENTATION=-
MGVGGSSAPAEEGGHFCCGGRVGPDTDMVRHDDLMAPVEGGRRLRSMGRKSSLRFTPGTMDMVLRQPIEKTEEDHKMIEDSLRTNPNLKRLAAFRKDQLRGLAKGAWKQWVEVGRTLMHEGDLNNVSFFIVASGTFDIVANEPFEVDTIDGLSFVLRPDMASKASADWASKKKVKTVRKVGPKTCFGDSSMLYGAPRWATMTAMERCSVWVISQANFKIAQQDLQRAVTPILGKNQEDEQLIMQALSKNLNLQRLVTLSEAHLRDLVRIAWRETLPEGQVLMREGDLNADALYIVSSGRLEFRGTEPFEALSHGETSHLTRAAHSGERRPTGVEEETVREFGRGLCFGEISMLYCAPRFATVTALEPVTLFAIDRSNFQFVQTQAVEDEFMGRVKYLESLDIMQQFSKDDKDKMASVMDNMRLKKDTVLSQQGEVCSALYILCKGSVAKLRDGQEEGSLQADPDSGEAHFIGAEDVVRAGENEVTVKVTSDSATCLVLQRQEFTKVWGRLVEGFEFPTFERSHGTPDAKAPKKEENSLNLAALKKIGLLGCGALGPVELHRHSKTKDLYALKTMSKGLIVQKGFRGCVMREKMLYTEVISPFIVRYFSFFRDDQSLHFLLEVALGGELASLYQRDPRCHGSNRHAKFYAAGVVLALEHLHKRKIVFRNIKPQNVLLSQRGHPKITDMGLAKRIAGHTFTTCGTPNYMAPEIVAGTGHNRSVDWWSLGVLIYWMMVGQDPFDSEHPMDIYSKVMRGVARVEFPSSCKGAVASVVDALLAQDAIDRLAMLQGGIENVLQHEWFESFDWAAMRSLTLEPPYVPKFATAPSLWKDRETLDSRDILSHFAPRVSRLPQPVQFMDDDSGWDRGLIPDF